MHKNDSVLWIIFCNLDLFKFLFFIILRNVYSRTVDTIMIYKDLVTDKVVVPIKYTYDSLWILIIELLLVSVKTSFPT